MQEPLRLALSLIGIVLILIAAYYATYYISTKASGQARAGKRSGGAFRSRGKSRHVALLERFAISKDKSFCIVEIAGKVYIVGVTNQSMTLLDTREPSELAQPSAAAAPARAGWQGQGQEQNRSGLYNNKLVKRLAAFIAYRTGRTTQAQEPAPDAGLCSAPGDADAGYGTFEAQMKSAFEKDSASCKTDSTAAETEYAIEEQPGSSANRKGGSKEQPGGSANREGGSKEQAGGSAEREGGSKEQADSSTRRGDGL